MSEKEFTYSRIDMDRPSFRLIRLLGGCATDIRCELFEAYLDDSYKDGIPYEALSYTWGTMNRTATIYINGLKARVTENLFMALHYLRPMDVDRILWIDALCIDQSNDKERGHQVQQMGDIYQKADGVVVWLGTATEETDSLMHFLTKMPAKRELVPEAERTRQCDFLRKLLDRDWFKRVWIIQEVAKARRAIVVCGSKSISTRVLTRAPSILGLEPDFHSKAVLEVMPGHLRASSWFEQQPTLCTLLQKFRGSEASDKRDMIYALLGMSSSAHERSTLQANYELDLKVLIRRTTSTLLFPALRVPADLHFINWSWPEFIQHLTALRFAALICAMEDQVSLERFVENSLNGPKWADIDLGFEDKHGRTALIIAARNGHDSFVRLLLEQENIYINAHDKSGATALWYAARFGHENIVRLLLQHGDVDINAQGQFGVTPLWTAAVHGQKNVAKLLLERGDINIDERNKDGMTAS